MGNVGVVGSSSPCPPHTPPPPIPALPSGLAYDNPLADRPHPDIESGRSLMPPVPAITVDRMLRRAADRIGVGKVGSWRAQGGAL